MCVVGSGTLWGTRHKSPWGRSFGFKICEEVGVVKGVHLFSDEVRSVISALKVVEEVQEGLQEIKGEQDEEIGWNGEP